MKKKFEEKSKILIPVAVVVLLLVACLLFVLKPWNGSAIAKPENVKAAARSTGILLTWTRGGSNVTGYNIYLNGQYWKTYGKDAKSADLAGLVAGSKYTISINAIDAAHHASEKVTVTATPLVFQITQSNPVKTAAGSFPEYKKFQSAGTAGAVVPGLSENLVPQGIAYAPSKKWLIMSAYSSDGTGSMLSVVDATTGKLIKSVGINDVNKKQYKGHAGGVTVSASNVWVASDGYLRRIPLQDIVNAENGAKVTVADRFNTANNASFAMYANGILWSGEFYQVTSYQTAASHTMTAKDGTTHHAWLTGFKLDSSTDTLAAGKIVNDTTPVTPDCILSIPELVQGSQVLSDGTILLSESYGRTTDSVIQRYSNVLTQPQHTATTINGKSVPVWFLDGKSMLSSVTAFPMAEGLIVRDGLVDILFESGAAEYRGTCKYPLGTLWELKSNFFS